VKVLLALAVLVLLACASRPAPAPAVPDAEAARGLLVEYEQMMRQLAEGGETQQVIPTVDGLDAKTKQLADAQQLGREFTDRYRRVLRVTRATAMPATEDSTKEIAEFVKDIEGRAITGGGLASVAPALVEELLNMHQLIEPDESRDALRARYFPGG
jgi:hypothetical protein